MPNNRKGPFLKAFGLFQDTYKGADGIVSIEEGSVTVMDGPHWIYAIKVKVRPGATPGLPKLYNGYNVIVEEVKGETQSE